MAPPPIADRTLTLAPRGSGAQIEVAPTAPAAFDASRLPAGARKIEKPKVVSAQGKTPPPPKKK